MLKVSQLMRVEVFCPKRGRKGDIREYEHQDLSVVGKVRQVVFAPSGDRVVGFLVRRPDVAGMVRRADAFLALDSFVVGKLGLVVSRTDDGMDDAARERLGLDWDRCILWTGMDAKTTDGKELGWVSDVEFDPKTGAVSSFFVGDGSVATSLVGNVVIPAGMLRGYREGFMLVDPAAATLSLDGGLAARAGEGYARAKMEGKEVASRAGKVAGDAMEKGAYGLGRALGKAKRALSDDAGSDQDAGGDNDSEHNSDPDKPDERSAGEPGEKPVKKPTGKKSSTAKAVGKQLGRTRGMFGSFVSEFKKASK